MTTSCYMETYVRMHMHYVPTHVEQIDFSFKFTSWSDDFLLHNRQSYLLQIIIDQTSLT